MTKFYTIYDVPPKVDSPTGGASLTDQSALKDTDLNTILARFRAGDVTAVRGKGVFADVSDYGDFAKSMERVRQANDEFASLPSNVRDRFGNDPVALVKFLEDRTNDDEAVRLGLKVIPTVQPSLTEQIVHGVKTALSTSAPSAD